MTWTFARRLFITVFFFAAPLFAANTQLPLLGEALYPESIAYDSRNGALYVTSNGDGSIQAIQNGVARIFQAGGTDGRDEALGIKVDEARDRLWVSGVNAVYVYQLTPNRLVAKIEMAAIASVKKAGLNDIVIDGEGNAYVTDSFNPILIKIQGDTFKGSVFRHLGSAIPYGKQNDIGYNLNGIVFSRDKTSLIAVKTNEGTLWRISLTDNTIGSIKLSEPVLNGDGLVWGDNATLYVMRNFANKVSFIDFSNGDDKNAKVVSTFVPTEVSIPTSAVFVPTPRASLFLVNSQFGIKSPTVPFTITKVDL